VLYITERAVFRLTGSGLELIEIAPGIDLSADVLGQMDFTPAIAANLKLMSAEVFWVIRRSSAGYRANRPRRSALALLFRLRGPHLHAADHCAGGHPQDHGDHLRNVLRSIIQFAPAAPRRLASLPKSVFTLPGIMHATRTLS